MAYEANSIEHYFVVKAEVNKDGTLSFVLDHDTADARFSEGTVYDITKEKWLRCKFEPEQDPTDNLDTLAKVSTVAEMRNNNGIVEKHLSRISTSTVDGLLLVALNKALDLINEGKVA